MAARAIKEVLATTCAVYLEEGVINHQINKSHRCKNVIQWAERNDNESDTM